MGIVATDGAHFGRLGLGRADNLADEWDAFDAFENHGNNGAGHHVGDVVMEGLFATASNHLTDVLIVGAVVVFRWFNHFHADDFEADALKTLKDFPDKAALNGIGL